MRRWAGSFGVLTMLMLVLGSGCTRYAATRVYLHGQVESEEGSPVAYAVVRVEGFETLSDQKGRYRTLYLARCVRSGAGAQGVQTPEVEVFAAGFEPFKLGFHLDAIGAFGGGSCPADTDKFLRLTLLKAKPGRY